MKTRRSGRAKKERLKSQSKPKSKSKSKPKEIKTSKKQTTKILKAYRDTYSMFSCKDTAVNLVDDACGNDIQIVPSTSEPAYSPIERPATQASLKRKKKPCDNQGNVNETSDNSYFMNDSTEWDSPEQQINETISNNWKVNDSEDEVQGDSDDDSTQVAPKEKRNLGSPLVIDMLTDGVTSIDLPQIFEHEQGTRLGTTCDDAFELNALFNKDIEFINSKYNTHIQVTRLKQASLVPSNSTKNDASEEASDDRLKDISADNSSPTRSPTSRELEGGNPRRSVDRDSEPGAQSLRHKHVGSRRRGCKRKSPKFYCIRNIVIVIMESGGRLCFTGKLLVKVLYGAAKIYGSVLDKSTDATEVYSPRGYSNVVIETGEEFPEGSVDDVWTALGAEGVTRDSESQLRDDVDSVRPGAAVLVLQDFENNLTLFLKTHFRHFRLFPSVKNPSYFAWTDRKRAEIVLQANLHVEQLPDDFKCRRLITDPCITADIAGRMLSRWRANEWSCTLIAGGKDVGKSTSARCLINSLLRTSGKAVLVDVDPGQAECTPPGCLSYTLIEEPLMGPNFTHLRPPVYQLFIDDVNVSRCVTRYLEGVKMLIEKLKECPVLSRLPIVVNTMGFARSIGWDIAISTIKLIRPTIVLQIMSSKRKNNYVDVLSAVVVNNQECSWTFCDESFINWDRPCEHDLCVIYSQAEAAVARRSQWNMEPYQQRELVMMSYLSGIVDDKNDSLQYNTGLSLSINEAVPFTAPFSSLCIIPQRLFGVPASRALSVINGNIVALCGVDLTGESSETSKDISSLRVLTQRSPLCTCYGFGIIRGVDMERQEVYINTPLPISIMQHVNCLAGCIPVPPSLLQLHQGAPYVGEDAALPTSRKPRRGYFRMRYQNKPSKS